MVDADFSCQYPEFADPCFPSVGCDPDAGTLTCDEFTIDGGPQAVFPACGTPCNVPTDCPDSTATCYQAYVDDGGLVGACLTNVCDMASVFTSCYVGDGGPDGICLPIGEAFVCNQTGPVPTNGSCSGAPIDAGAYLCQAGDLCFFGPSGQTLRCLVICLGGMACPGSTSCVPDYGLCLTPCKAPADPICSSPFTCQDLLSTTGTPLGKYCAPP
jgi:hypothetical protein